MNKKVCFAVAAALSSGTVLAAGSVVFDNTLPGQPAGKITTVPLVNGHYTISAASTGYLSGANLFESFSTFIVATAEEADFTNPTNLSIGNVISRVTGVGSPTGLQPTTINGSVVSTIGNANFWFINPSGVTIGAGAKINVPAGLAIGAGDYISFADGARFYALPSNGPQPAVFTTARPTAFGFLPTPASGAVALTGTDIALNGPITLSAGPRGISLTNSALTTTNNTPGGGSASGPDITLTSNGGPVTLQSSTLTTNNIPEPNGSPIVAAAGSINLSGQTVSIHGGSLYSQSLNGGNGGSMAITATGNAANAIQIDGGATVFSDASEANTAIVNGNIVSIGNAGSISLAAPAGGIVINGTGTPSGGGLQTLAGDQNPSGAGLNAGNAGPISLEAGQIKLTNATLNTTASSQTTNGAQQNAQGVTRLVPLAPAPIRLQSAGPVTISGSTVSTLTQGHVAAGTVDVSGSTVSVSGSHLSTQTALFEGFVVPTGAAGDIDIASSGQISIRGSALSSQTQGTGSGGDVRITGAGNDGVTRGILLTGSSIATGALPAPGIPAGAAGSVSISGPSYLQSNSSIDTSTIGSGDGGNISITARGTAGVGAAQGGTGDALLITGSSTVSAASPSVNLIVGAPPGAIALDAPAGSIRINSGSTVTTSAANNQGGPITFAAATGIALDDATLTSNSDGGGAGNSPVNITLRSSGPITLSGGTTVSTSTGGAAPANNVFIDAAGALTLTGNTSVTSGTTREDRAGDIALTGRSVHVTGGEVSATTAGTAAAGSVTIRATGTDSNAVAALQVNGGAVITSDATAQAYNSSSPAGNILLSAPQGTVSVVGTPGGGSTTISSSTVSAAGGQAGTVTLSGANVLVSGATIETTVAAQGLPGAAPASVTVNASGNVALVNSLLDAQTSGSVPAGDVRITGATVSVSGGQVTASTTGTADAGSVLLTATGTKGTDGTAALLVSGGAAISSDASAGEGAQANAGSVKLAAPSGTVQLGLPTDTAPSSLSTVSGAIGGAAGAVTINGAGIDLGKAQISTSTASAVPNPTRGTITMDAGKGDGPLTITNSTLSAATSGVQQAGKIDLLGSRIVIGNSTITSATTGGGSAGAVCVGNPGCVAAGVTVPATGGTIRISNSTLTTSTSTAGTAGEVQVNGSSVSVSGGRLTASTTGTGKAGSVSLTATGVSGANGAAALQVIGGASIASGASGGTGPHANAGFVRLAAPSGTVQVGLATDSVASSLSAPAGAHAGAAGEVMVTGAAVDLQKASISTATASVNPSPIRGMIMLDAGNGSGPLTIANSILNVATSGVQQAGEIELLASPIVITNSTILSAPTETGSAGAVCVGNPGCLAAGVTEPPTGGTISSRDSTTDRAF